MWRLKQWLKSFKQSWLEDWARNTAKEIENNGKYLRNGCHTALTASCYLILDVETSTHPTSLMFEFPISLNMEATVP